MTRRSDPFAHAEATAREWLGAVADSMGTGDHRYAYRALRAWLHVVRDRLTPETAAHLGAQLPELLRGVFYEGWNPSRVPARYDTAHFVAHYAEEAGIAPADVAATTVEVSEALRARFSPGQFEHVSAQLPRPLRALLTTYTADAPPDERRRVDRHEDGSRLRRLEDRVELLTDAVSELAHGLETNPLDEPDGARATRTASSVRRLLLDRGARTDTTNEPAGTATPR